MRIISTIAVAALALSMAGCLSYSKHEREDRVVEHRRGSHHDERSHRYGGYYERHRPGGHHHGGGHDDHRRDRGDRYRHHPHGR
jgi:hypothetical protein